MKLFFSPQWLFAVFAGCLLSAAQAQTAYPNRAVRLVVAAAPGGGTDILGRMMAQRLSDRLGQAFVVENKGGGGGSVAADFVAKSPANGYTLLVTNDQLTVGASFAGASNYDVMKDFAPIGLIGRTSIVVGVNPSVPANTIGELIALVRANPGKYSFSSCGHGTPLHLAGEMLNLSARIDMVHVPYRGCSPALADAVSGQVPIFFNMISNSLPHAKNGKVRLLAAASLQRLPSQPQLPTIAEAGFPAFDAYPWFGILAPAGTPREIVQMLSNELAAAVQSAEIGDKLRGMNFEPTVATPESFADIMRTDLVRWGRVVREAKVKAAPE